MTRFILCLLAVFFTWACPGAQNSYYGNFTGNGTALTNNAGQPVAFLSNIPGLTAGANVVITTSVSGGITNYIISATGGGGGGISSNYAGVVFFTNNANIFAGTFIGNGTALTNVTDAGAARLAGNTGQNFAVSNLVVTAGGNVSGAFTNGNLTAHRAVYSDGNLVLQSSATTDTELGYLHGVTSGIQAQINALPVLAGSNAWTTLGTNAFNGVVLATNVNNVFYGAFTGNGGGLTNLNASQLITGAASVGILGTGPASGSILYDLGGVGTWSNAPPGTVTSVGLVSPTDETVSGSPVTGVGTLTITRNSQSQNLVLASPNGSSGTPGYRALVVEDIPALPYDPLSAYLALLSSSNFWSGTNWFGTNVTFVGTDNEALNQTLVGPGSLLTKSLADARYAPISVVGSVTSVGLSAPDIFSVSGSPVTASGTLALSLVTQNANLGFFGPASGSAAVPTFRAMVPLDIAGTPTSGYLPYDLGGNLVWSNAPAGTVTSVAATVPSDESVSGSPVTGTGTLAITRNSQSQNLVLASPNGSSGTPTFRVLVSGDIPALSYVTSVSETVPSFLSISGSPVTSSGTLAITLASQNANLVFAGPVSGSAAAPTFRAMVPLDLAGSPASNYLPYDLGGNIVWSNSPVGTVTSVNATVPADETVSGGPVTGAGTLAITRNSQSANLFLAAPNGSSGTPGYRAIVSADILSGVNLTNENSYGIPVMWLGTGGNGGSTWTNTVNNYYVRFSSNASVTAWGLDHHFGINQTNMANTNTFTAGDGGTFQTNNNSQFIGSSMTGSNNSQLVAIGPALNIKNLTNEVIIGVPGSTLSLSNTTATFSSTVSIVGNANIHGANYVWPTGNLGGTLQNDGSGNLSWTPVSGVTIPNTIKATNFVLNTVYTNTTGSIQLLDATVALITTGVSGNASLDLYADQAGGTAFVLQDRAAISTLITSIAQNYTNNLSGAISNGATYYFTNSSTGSGDSALIVAGTGAAVTLSDGAAANVASLSGNNSFSGANTFSGLTTLANQTNTGYLAVAGNATNFGALTVVGGLTNVTLSPSALAATGTGTNMVSIANGTGFLNNNGSGTFSYILDGSTLTNLTYGPFGTDSGSSGLTIPANSVKYLPLFSVNLNGMQTSDGFAHAVSAFNPPFNITNLTAQNGNGNTTILFSTSNLMFRIFTNGVYLSPWTMTIQGANVQNQTTNDTTSIIRVLYGTLTNVYSLQVSNTAGQAVVVNPKMFFRVTQ